MIVVRWFIDEEENYLNPIITKEDVKSILQYIVCLIINKLCYNDERYLIILSNTIILYMDFGEVIINRFTVDQLRYH